MSGSISMTKTFLLGLGAQKAGTSWLWRYLKSHPQAALGPLKEFAVWQTVLAPDAPSERRRAKIRDLIADLEVLAGYDTVAEIPEKKPAAAPGDDMGGMY